VELYLYYAYMSLWHGQGKLTLYGFQVYLTADTKWRTNEKEISTCETSIFTDQQLYREIQLILLSKNINHSVLSIKVVN